MKKLFFLLALAGWISAQSQTVSSVQSGDWDDPTTWSSNPSLPDDGDDIVISSGHTVTLDGTPDITLDEVTLTINGTLEMTDNGLDEANLELTGYSGILLNGQIVDNVSDWTALNDNEGESAIIVDGDVVWTACDGNGLSDAVCFIVYEANYLLIDAEPDNYSDQDGSGSPMLMPTSNNPLPVTLISYYIKTEESTCTISWSTSSELNNDHFIIERSDNGVDFYDLGKVNGHGTTTSNNLYSFKDSSPRSAMHYYRLTQVDHDGTSTYLGTKVAEFGQLDLSNVRIYPNPTSDVLYMNVSEANTPKQIRLIHSSGKTGWNLTPFITTKGNKLKITMPIVSRGIYFLEFTAQNGEKNLSKLVISN